MTTKPINDLVKVLLDDKKYGDFTSSEEQKGFEVGTLVDVTDKIYFLSSFSYVLEQSFSHPENLEELRQFWVSQIGKKVRWEERADKGFTYEEDGKQYASIKITKLHSVIEESLGK